MSIEEDQERVKDCVGLTEKEKDLLGKILRKKVSPTAMRIAFFSRLVTLFVVLFVAFAALANQLVGKRKSWVDVACFFFIAVIFLQQMVFQSLFFRQYSLIKKLSLMAGLNKNLE